MITDKPHTQLMKLTSQVTLLLALYCPSYPLPLPLPATATAPTATAPPLLLLPPSRLLLPPPPPQVNKVMVELLSGSMDMSSVDDVRVEQQLCMMEDVVVMMLHDNM